jgi:predicted RNase H-like nuclease (RuvC/YqgF family)
MESQSVLKEEQQNLEEYINVLEQTTSDNNELIETLQTIQSELDTFETRRSRNSIYPISSIKDLLQLLIDAETDIEELDRPIPINNSVLLDEFQSTSKRVTGVAQAQLDSYDLF